MEFVDLDGEENHKDTKGTKTRKRILSVLCVFVVKKEQAT
jgi:hypothetical protein